MNTKARMDEFAAIVNELEIPCEKRMNPHCDHTNPAAWVAWSACTCPESPAYYLWCTPCKDRMMTADVVHCGFCRRRFDSFGEAFLRLEPLNRSAA